MPQTFASTGRLLCVAISLAVLCGSVHAQSAYAQSADKQPTTVTAAGITLKSVSIDLPAGDRVFAGGTAAEVVNNNCLTCHSAGMVLNQPALSPATWKAEVTKMQVVYKAPVSEEDVPAIVAYLSAIKPGN